jgi:type II secretory pathway predicted ATPase ExeA
VYELYYGFRVHPFSLVPDPAFLFLGRKHKLALSLLEYGLINRSAFTVITGEPGTGKTTLLNAIFERSEREVTLGVLSHTHVGLGSLMPWVLMTFGLDGKGMDSVELYRAFAGFLAQEHARQRRVVLVVDEAQNLGPAMLEELRLLSNLNDGRRQPLQIILSGQPALQSLLKQVELVQLAQRISVDYHLEELAESETPDYIRHRIRIAGGPVTMMTDLACVAAHRLSRGNPRLINQVCDVALAYGFAAESRWITAQLVSKAATDRSAGGILPLAGGSAAVSFTENEQQAEREQVDALSRPVAPMTESKPAAQGESATAVYKRGVAFKEAGAYRQAMMFFEQACRDETLVMMAKIQIALCLRASGRTEEAVRSFQRLWDGGTGTVEERKQLRYFLARTLEAAGHVDKAVDHYEALRNEQSNFRDVQDRLGRLSGSQPSEGWSYIARNVQWTRLVSRGWTQLTRSLF